MAQNFLAGYIGTKCWRKLLRILPKVIEKSFINWRVLPQVKINTRISDTPCIYQVTDEKSLMLYLAYFLSE
jgi:hypothetical protein